jgi:hypothetical protein
MLTGNDLLTAVQNLPSMTDPFDKLIEETPMTITATQILEMLEKARRLGINYEVYEDPDYNSYFIEFVVTWYADEYGGCSYEKVFVSKDNVSDGYGGWDVFNWNRMLNEKLKQKEQKELKEEKRKALIARLTPEERELLEIE